MGITSAGVVFTGKITPGSIFPIGARTAMKPGRQKGPVDPTTPNYGSIYTMCGEWHSSVLEQISCFLCALFPLQHGLQAR